MQIASNSLGPPRFDTGRTDLGKGQPEEIFEFKTMMQASQSKSSPKADSSGRGKQSVEGGSEKGRQAQESSKGREDQSTRREQPEEDGVRETRGSARSQKANKSKDSKVRDQGKSKTASVQKFMDSLESEFGISGERFSAVLMQLPEEVKALPIEQSAPFVVKQLGVPAELQPQMTTAYLNLLREAGLEGAKTPLMSSTAGFESNAMKELNSLRGLDRQKLNAGIDEMNRRFFDVAYQPDPSAQRINDPSAITNASEGLMSGGLSDEAQTSAIRGQVSTRIDDSLSKDTRALEKLLGLDQLGLSAEELESLAVEAQTEPAVPTGQRPWSVEELPFLVENELNSGLQSSQGQSNQGGSDASFGQEFSDSGNGALTEFNQKAGLVRDAERDAEGNKFEADQQQALFAGASLSGKPESAPNEIGKMSSPLTSEQKAANLAKMKEATEALSARGGGEMKVVLTPEGMGKVQLKVKMHEGKIQVELKAENQESQKLLENSLVDLKQQLSSHRLSVDSVKVDVAGDFNRQDSSSTFSQPQFDQSREQARQFMNLFREGNLSQRQGFFEAPGFKSYRSQREESLGPISSEIRPRSSLSTSKGREINLVA